MFPSWLMRTRSILLERNLKQASLVVPIKALESAVFPCVFHSGLTCEKAVLLLIKIAANSTKANRLTVGEEVCVCVCHISRYLILFCELYTYILKNKYIKI